MDIVIKDVTQEEIGWERHITVQHENEEYEVLLQWDKYNGFLLIDNGGLNTQINNYEFNSKLDELSYLFLEERKK